MLHYPYNCMNVYSRHCIKAYLDQVIIRNGKDLSSFSIGQTPRYERFPKHFHPRAILHQAGRPPATDSHSILLQSPHCLLA